MTTQKLIFVTGPTGCGKSENAQALADFFGCECILVGESSEAIARMLDTVYPHSVLVISSATASVIKHAFPAGEVHEYLPACRAAGISPFHGPDGRILPYLTEPKPEKAEWIPEPAEEYEARQKKELAKLGAYGVDLAVLGEVLTERKKQQDKGYDASSDDWHTEHELAMAAYAYIDYSVLPRDSKKVPWPWPWDKEAFSPDGTRANLIKAAALLVAEVQRIDRQEETVRAGIKSMTSREGEHDHRCDAFGQDANGSWFCDKIAGHSDPCHKAYNVTDAKGK